VTPSAAGAASARTLGNIIAPRTEQVCDMEQSSEEQLQSSATSGACRFCPGVGLTHLVADIYACPLCGIKRCSYCKLDEFSGHWTKRKPTCKLRGFHLRFNLFSLFVSNFSP
jgi:hypothetical protein